MQSFKCIEADFSNNRQTFSDDSVEGNTSKWGFGLHIPEKNINFLIRAHERGNFYYWAQINI